MILLLCVATTPSSQKVSHNHVMTTTYLLGWWPPSVLWLLTTIDDSKMIYRKSATSSSHLLWTEIVGWVALYCQDSRISRRLHACTDHAFYRSQHLFSLILVRLQEEREIIRNWWMFFVNGIAFFLSVQDARRAMVLCCKCVVSRYCAPVVCLRSEGGCNRD